MSTNISLTPELEAYAKSKVEEGLYSSVSELMREALRLLRSQDIEYIQKLRAELDEAARDIAEGRLHTLNMQDIIDEVEAELSE